jgi:hypothetical protein
MGYPSIHVADHKCYNRFVTFVNNLIYFRFASSQLPVLVA